MALILRGFLRVGPRIAINLRTVDYIRFNAKGTSVDVKPTHDSFWTFTESGDKEEFEAIKNFMDSLPTVEPVTVVKDDPVILEPDRSGRSKESTLSSNSSRTSGLPRWNSKSKF